MQQGVAAKMFRRDVQPGLPRDGLQPGQLHVFGAVMQDAGHPRLLHGQVVQPRQMHRGLPRALGVAQAGGQQGLAQHALIIWLVEAARGDVLGHLWQQPAWGVRQQAELGTDLPGGHGHQL